MGAVVAVHAGMPCARAHYGVRGGKAPAQATQAFQVGNKALAKELGAKGRWHADQMKEAHAHASSQIFLQRNGMGPGAVGGVPMCGGGGDQPALFDLHGLHVTEALDVRTPGNGVELWRASEILQAGETRPSQHKRTAPAGGGGSLPHGVWGWV